MPCLYSSERGYGLSCAEVDDPYAAAVELARRPMVYRALILSLASLYKGELDIIAMVKRRMPHVEVWLTHTEGRVAALAEAVRLGADGILSEEGLHRTAAGAPAQEISPGRSNADANAADETSGRQADEDLEEKANEPLLTADELRALLHEQPNSPEQ